MSPTYIAAAVALIATLLKVSGYTVDEGTLTANLDSIAQVASILYVFYGRYKAGGISALGIRKDMPTVKHLVIAT